MVDKKKGIKRLWMFEAKAEIIDRIAACSLGFSHHKNGDIVLKEGEKVRELMILTDGVAQAVWNPKIKRRIKGELGGEGFKAPDIIGGLECLTDKSIKHWWQQSQGEQKYTYATSKKRRGMIRAIRMRSAGTIQYVDPKKLISILAPNAVHENLAWTEESFELIFQLFKQLSLQRKRNYVHIEALSLPDEEYRLGLFLYTCAEKDGVFYNKKIKGNFWTDRWYKPNKNTAMAIKVPLQKDIGAYICGSEQLVRRAFKALEDRRIIVRKGRLVIIPYYKSFKRLFAVNDK